MGAYWAQRAATHVYDKTGVRLTVIPDKYSANCTLHTPDNFYAINR